MGEDFLITLPLLSLKTLIIAAILISVFGCKHLEPIHDPLDPIYPPRVWEVE